MSALKPQNLTIAFTTNLPLHSAAAATTLRCGWQPLSVTLPGRVRCRLLTAHVLQPLSQRLLSLDATDHLVLGLSHGMPAPPVWLHPLYPFLLLQPACLPLGHPARPYVCSCSGTCPTCCCVCCCCCCFWLWPQSAAHDVAALTLTSTYIATHPPAHTPSSPPSAIPVVLLGVVLHHVTRSP